MTHEEMVQEIEHLKRANVRLTQALLTTVAWIVQASNAPLRQDEFRMIQEIIFPPAPLATPLSLNGETNG